ncbi:hypothetical protein TNCV_939321 [Trichonephila clavipes]|nr:hypothetical protein TNCV_939321 [Trichonephila clavipes]
MTRRRVENREGSLGYPRFVRPVFTKDGKPLGKRKRSLGKRLLDPGVEGRGKNGSLVAFAGGKHEIVLDRRKWDSFGEKVTTGRSPA